MSIDRCPDELLLVILRHLAAEDLARACQGVSRRFNRLSNDAKIWHCHCCNDYQYWNEADKALLRTAALSRTYGHGPNHPWKALWLRRKRGDRVLAMHFEHVLASKVHRNYHLSAICAQQLDAKDFLRREYRAADLQAFHELDAGDRGARAPPSTSTGINDCLARRYYASMAAGSINRSLAVEEWIRVRDQRNQFQRLDRALAAFDMFALLDDGPDMDRVAGILDRLAVAFVEDMGARFDNMSVRETSYQLVTWLRRHNLVGMANADMRYRDLRNCLIGQALSDHPGHPSLPLISSAIFACIGQRLGLPAYCLAIPGHVHATVLAKPGITVDGKPRALRPMSDRSVPQRLLDNGERIFFDPFRDNHELALQQLRHSMDELALGTEAPVLIVASDVVYPTAHVAGQAPNGVAAAVAEEPDDGPENGSAATPAPTMMLMSRRDSLLLPTPTDAIVVRLAHNISASWAYTTQMDVHSATRVKRLFRRLPAFHYADADQARCRHRCGSYGDPDADMERMTYGSAWATMLMQPTGHLEWEQMLDRLLNRFVHEYNEDAWIIEKYLLPIHNEHFQGSADARPDWHPGHGEDGPRANTSSYLHNILRMVRNLDGRQPAVTRRYTQEILDNVHYKVGQVIRHRRIGFVGIIDGWTPRHYNDLPGPAVMSRGETDHDAGADTDAGTTDTGTTTAGRDANARPAKSTYIKPYYSVMYAGVDRHVVAQHNIEIVTDPRLVPPELMFFAGKVFKRFNYATCTFESNLTEFFPDG